MELDKLAPALVALQADLTPVAKSKVNPFYKSSYAPLSEVMETIQPLLAKHGLAVSQFMAHLDEKSALRTVLLHTSGQYIEDVSPLLLTKQDAQSQGSAVTYARRYGIMSILGIVADEDDDGNKASTPAGKAPVIRNRQEEAAQGPSPMGENEDDVFARAKKKINEELEAHDYTRVDQKKAFISIVLEKPTIDNLNDCDLVMDALENEQ
jgi:hypothetical protein